MHIAPRRSTAFVFCFLLSAASNSTAQGVEPKVVVETIPCPLVGTVRVFVSSAGAMELDGSPGTLAQLSARISSLGPGLVKFCYSNEGDPTSEEAQESAFDALEVIAKTRLPIDFYEDKHFQRRTRIVF